MYILFAVLATAYLALIWVIPSNHNPAAAHFNLSSSALHAISISVALPLLAIWFIAFYGYAKLNEYATLIKKSKEGKAVRQLARGIGALALVLPLISIISSALNYIGQTHVRLLPTTVVINSYTNLILPLIAFFMIGYAGRKLLDFVKERVSFWITQFAVLLIAAVSAVYAYSTYTILNGNNLGSLINHKIYYQPTWLVVTTIIIPYIFMWTIGGMAALDIHSYAKKTTGVLYRHDWNYISAGVVTIIVTEVIEQYLTSLTARLSHIHLTALLIIIYLLLTLVAVGFVLIAVGSKRLRKMEMI